MPATITKVQRTWSKTSAGLEEIAGADAVKITAARGYMVWFSACSEDNVITALTASDGTDHVPVRGESWSSAHADIRCRNVRPVRVLSSNGIELVAEFSGGDDPLDLPAQKAWRGIKVMSEVNDDATGRALQNVNGSWITGCQRCFYDLAYAYRRNEGSDAMAVSDYRGSVNLNPVTLNGHTFPARSCLLDNIEADRTPQNTGYFYWTMLYSVIRRRRVISGSTVAGYEWNGSAWVAVASGTDIGWRRRELNHGPKVRPAAGQAPVSAMDLLGESDVALALDGTLLPDRAEQVFLLFDDHPALDWAPLGIG